MEIPMKKYHGKLIESSNGRINLLLASNKAYINYLCYDIERMTYYDIHEDTLEHLISAYQWIIIS